MHWTSLNLQNVEVGHCSEKEDYGQFGVKGRGWGGFHTLPSHTVQFSSWWYPRAPKSPYALHPIYQRFPQHWQWPVIVLSRKIIDRAFPLSTPLSHMRLMVPCPWVNICTRSYKVSQPPQHFRYLLRRILLLLVAQWSRRQVSLLDSHFPGL